MANLIVRSAIICLAAISTSAYADKLVIKGEPMVLEKQGEVYIVPETYKVQEFQYVVIDGQKRACFLDKMPDFVNVDVVSIMVQTGPTKSTWNCYSPDPKYFVIQ